MFAVCWSLLISLSLTSFGTLVFGSESNPQIPMPWEFFFFNACFKWPWNQGMPIWKGLICTISSDFFLHGLNLNFCMCVHMCMPMVDGACVCGGQSSTFDDSSGCHSPCLFIWYLFICTLFKIGSLIGLAFTSSSRLASQQAPVSCLSLLPQC